MPAVAKRSWRIVGEKVIQQGRYERLSPYYEDPGADIFWYAGYDGLTLQEAIILHDAAYDKGREAA